MGVVVSRVEPTQLVELSLEDLIGGHPYWETLPSKTHSFESTH